jgi:glycosyltransferase involved in cell wall biosynthesis
MECKFSIVIGFRGRELTRIKNSLDSLSQQKFNNFELVFIDYGDDTDIAEAVKALVESYSFSEYYYSDTRGMFWNRAHALNTGIHFAKGEIILFSDIDLVYPNDFLENIAALSFERKFYTFSCYYLPEGQSPFETSSEEIKALKNHYVGLCAASKESVTQIRGFNEYYMVWGGEDDELYEDLASAGNEWRKFTAQEFPVLHQWHPNHAPPHPTPWYLETLNHLYIQNREIGAKKDSYGTLIQQCDRTVMQKNDNDDNFQSLEFMEHSWLQYNLFTIGFGKMKSKEFGRFEYPIRPLVKAPKGRKDRVVEGVNKVLGRIEFPYFFQKDLPPKIEIHTRERWLEFILYFIGRNRALIKDYYLLDTPERLVLYFQKN